MAHQNAAEMAKSGVTVWPVEHDTVRAFDDARRDFKKSCDTFVQMGGLEKFSSICSQIHARICRTPCSPSWLIEGVLPQIKELQPVIKREIGSADRRLQEDYERLCKALVQLRKVEVNPLATEVREMLSLSEEASERCVIVIRQQALWANVVEALNPSGAVAGLVLMKPSELRRLAPVDRIILFGPPWLFEFREELFLFRSPAGKSIDLFVYNHDSGGKITGSAFEQEEIPLNGIDSRPVHRQEIEAEPFVFQPLTFSFRQFTRTEYESEIESLVEAWPVNLGGENNTFLHPAGSIYTLECRHEGEAAICTGVERKDVEDLEAGDLAVLTTEGGGDLIRPLADLLLGDQAPVFRRRQDEWKGKLWEAVEEEGIARVVEKLRSAGSELASAANVRNWSGEQNIGPLNLEKDFNAVLEVVGLATAGQEYRDAINAIRGAHQSAGFQLHGRLRDTLKGMNVRQALVNGALEVRAEEEGPAKTVFLVEHISREIASVPSWCVGRIFPSEDN